MATTNTRLPSSAQLLTSNVPIPTYQQLHGLQPTNTNININTRQQNNNQLHIQTNNNTTQPPTSQYTNIQNGQQQQQLHPQPQQQQQQQQQQQPNPGDPNNLNLNDDDDNEYNHKYQPVDTRELTDAEKLFMEYACNGQLDSMIDLYNKTKNKSTNKDTTSISNLTASAQHSMSIDIDCCDLWGSTPLMHASVRQHINVFKWLCSVGADINKQDYRGITVLMECCWNNKVEWVKMILSGKTGSKQQVDTNLTDERDYTALMQAAEEGHSSVVQLLIEYGADLNKQEKKRSYTSLMWAVVEGHPSVVQLLVNAGAALNLHDKYGFTALMQAARTRFLAAVLLLVGNGADLDTRDKKNRNVYDLANAQVLQAIDKGKRELRRRYIQILSTHPAVTHLHNNTLHLITAYIIST